MKKIKDLKPPFIAVGGMVITLEAAKKKYGQQDVDKLLAFISILNSYEVPKLWGSLPKNLLNMEGNKEVDEDGWF